MELDTVRQYDYVRPNGQRKIIQTTRSWERPQVKASQQEMETSVSTVSTFCQTLRKPENGFFPEYPDKSAGQPWTGSCVILSVEPSQAHPHKLDLQNCETTDECCFTHEAVVICYEEKTNTACVIHSLQIVPFNAHQIANFTSVGLERVGFGHHLLLMSVMHSKYKINICWLNKWGNA